jgi:tetrahydromethanopterin S-methyltransferase subunit G
VDAAAQLETLLDLEARHEDLLQRLDELDRRVEKVLGECLRGRQPGEASGQ